MKNSPSSTADEPAIMLTVAEISTALGLGNPRSILTSFHRKGHPAGAVQLPGSGRPLAYPLPEVHAWARLAMPVRVRALEAWAEREHGIPATSWREE